MERDILRGAQPRVFVTEPDAPEEGLTFIWARGRWYQRVEGDMGNVAFPPIADSEEELRQWVSQEGQPDLTELDEDYAGQVAREFREQWPLYPEAPELSDEDASQET